MTEVTDRATARKWAQESPYTLVFVGPDATQIPPLGSLVPDYSVVGPASTALDRLADAGTATFAADPALRSAEALLEDEGVQGWFEEIDNPAVLVFKSSFALEQMAASHGWHLLAAPANLSRRWENKVAFAELGAALNLPMAPTLVVSRSESFDAVAGRLGADLVIQAPHGYSGARTRRVRDRRAYDAALKALRVPKLRLTAYLAGRPVTLTACVTAAGVAVARPCVQITGEPSLTPYSLGSCGNDWVAPLPGRPETLVAVAERLGDALGAAGFVGIFGVDFVVRPDGSPVVIEVNPRLVASAALYTDVETQAGRVPLLFRHVLAHLDPSADTLPLDAHWDPLPASQMILHNLENEAADSSGICGVFCWEPERNALVRQAGDGPGKRDEQHVTVVSQPAGRSVKPGGELGRVQCRTALTGNDGRLSPEAERLARAARALVEPAG